MTKKPVPQKSIMPEPFITLTVSTDETTAAMLLAAQEAGRPISLKLNEEAARVILGDDLMDSVQRIRQCDEDDFAILCEIGGLDKRLDFIGGDLEGVKLNCDLAGFNFKRANLRAAYFIGAKNLTEVISFEGADITGAQMTAQQFKIIKKKGLSAHPSFSRRPLRRQSRKTLCHKSREKNCTLIPRVYSCLHAVSR